MIGTISERNARIFREALTAMNESGIPYVVGGAFAIHHYTGVWRDTNDLDFYIDRASITDAIAILQARGFSDYGEMAAADREWIHHSIKEDVLVDLIWQTPNHLAQIDPDIFERGPQGEMLNIPTRYLPADTLTWAKIFTMNRHRSDWTDIFQVARACPPGLDWYRLLEKMGSNWPVLLSFIILFDWAYPDESYCIPDGIRQQLLDRKLGSLVPREEPARESLLDPWIYTRPLAP